MPDTFSTSRRPTSDADRIAKVVRIGQLLDLYGGLLTDRQRTFITQHYQEDLSFGEIARANGISRQAIHDAVKHAESALEEYEAKLCLLARGFGNRDAAPDAEPPAKGDAPTGGTPAAPAPGLGAEPSAKVLAAATKLREMSDTLAKSGGIIYNADGVVRELARLADDLAAAAQNP